MKFSRISNKRTLVAALVLSAGCALGAAEVDLSELPPAAKQQGLTYAKDIKPLLEAAYERCRGENRPKAGLRLTSLEDILKGTKDAKVIVPWSSQRSPLVIAVARLDPETAMPPTNRPGRFRGRGRGPGGPGGPSGPGSFGSSPKPLTPEQVGIIRAWIDQGAK